MDIRTMGYFLTIAQEGSISKAAQILHMSQPPLSRAMKDLEEELGVQLFVRGNRKIILSEEGLLLKDRAQEILDLFEKTRQEVSTAAQSVSGPVYIGAGETQSFALVGRAARKLQEKHPGIQYRLSSGDQYDVMEQLDKGLIDFGILFGDIRNEQYEKLTFPKKERRGILLSRKHVLAAKTEISARDLENVPLLVSRQSSTRRFLKDWMLCAGLEPRIAGTFSLIYNASLLAEENFACALTVEGLINTSGSRLSFVPLEGHQEVEVQFVWKKSHAMSRACQLFLAQMRQEIQEEKVLHPSRT